MKLASSFPGTSTAPLPSRMIAELTPNRGGRWRQAGPYTYNTVQIQYKGSTQYRYREKPEFPPWVYTCAFDGSYGVVQERVQGSERNEVVADMK